MRLRQEAIQCPGCDYDLRGTIAGGLKRCPECGRRFRLSEFEEDRRRNELRITGRWLVLLAIVWLVIVIAILWWMIIRPFQAF